MKKDLIFPIIMAIISPFMTVFAAHRGEILFAGVFLIISMVLTGMIMAVIILRKLVEMEDE